MYLFLLYSYINDSNIKDTLQCCVDIMKNILPKSTTYESKTAQVLFALCVLNVIWKVYQQCDGLLDSLKVVISGIIIWIENGLYSNQKGKKKNAFGHGLTDKYNREALVSKAFPITCNKYSP